MHDLLVIPDLARFVDGLRCDSQRPQFLQQIRPLPLDDVALQQVDISVEIARPLRERGQATVRRSGRRILDAENAIDVRPRVRRHQREVKILVIRAPEHQLTYVLGNDEIH